MASNNFRLLVLLGARMVKRGRLGRWQFPLFLEEPHRFFEWLPGEVSGGSSRMRGVQAVYETSDHGARQNFLVLVTGGTECDGSSRSDEAARQLVWRYGLPERCVVSIRGAGSTIGNAAATAEHIKYNSHLLVGNNAIEIVTNDYHMLRAWIIFSKKMREMAGRPELTISAAEQRHIGQILADGLAEKFGWSPSRVRADRKQVMEVLRPHFFGTLSIEPLVVEEILEHQSPCPSSGQRYARRLRNSTWVMRTIRLEYDRIIKLLG